jgi:hypothetical protein
VSETEAQKRARINATERDHGTEPAPAVAAAIPAGQPPGEDIDAPFHELLACPADWYAPRGMVPTSVVIHCTAATNPAASTAAYFHDCSSSHGSTQAVADDDQGFTCVPDDAVCAGAPPLNQEGLHIEQPGLVEWTREIWLAHPDDLKRVAYWTAQKCRQYGIPVLLLHADDLKLGGERTKGITYHAAITEAFHQSTHTDPGPNFPWDVFMQLVQTFYDGGGGDDEMAFKDFEDGYEFRRAHPKDPMPTGKSPSFQRGWHVRDLGERGVKEPAAGGAPGPIPEHEHHGADTGGVI